MENNLKAKHLYSSEEKLKWWGYGEWIEEPDLVEFEHKRIFCLIQRVCTPDGPVFIFGGFLCGYVFLPKDHPWIGKDYNNLDVDVHGGLTYGKQKNQGYSIGFDCAHDTDIFPYMQKFLSQHGLEFMYREQTYKNIEFVKKECINLADQVLAAIKQGVQNER